MNVKKKDIKSDLKRLDAMSDQDIDYSDIPEMGDDFFETAEINVPDNKISTHIRFDPEVVEYFKAGGKGYQTRINAVLRAYVRHKKKRRKTA